MKGQLAYKDVHGTVWFITQPFSDKGAFYASTEGEEPVINRWKLDDLIGALDAPLEMTTETPAESIQLESADKAAHPDLRDNADQ